MDNVASGVERSRGALYAFKSFKYLCDNVQRAGIAFYLLKVGCAIKTCSQIGEQICRSEEKLLPMVDVHLPANGTENSSCN
jgi:hypothetical protein